MDLQGLNIIAVKEEFPQALKLEKVLSPYIIHRLLSYREISSKSKTNILTFSPILWEKKLGGGGIWLCCMYTLILGSYIFFSWGY